MIVAMKNGGWYPIGPEDEPRVRFKYKQEFKEIDLYGDETVIVSRSGIDQLLTDEQFEMLERRKAGDWRCRDGEWHTKQDRYCGGHRPPEEPIDLSYLREGKEKAPLTETGKRWLELMRVNFDHQKRTGKYGTLRTLEQLDQFEKDGIWPEVVAKGSFNTRRVMRPKPNPFPVPGTKVEYEMVEVPID